MDVDGLIAQPEQPPTKTKRSRGDRKMKKTSSSGAHHKKKHSRENREKKNSDPAAVDGEVDREREKENLDVPQNEARMKKLSGKVNKSRGDGE